MCASRAFLCADLSGGSVESVSPYQDLLISGFHRWEGQRLSLSVILHHGFWNLLCALRLRRARWRGPPSCLVGTRGSEKDREGGSVELSQGVKWLIGTQFFLLANKTSQGFFILYGSFRLPAPSPMLKKRKKAQTTTKSWNLTTRAVPVVFTFSFPQL